MLRRTPCFGRGGAVLLVAAMPLAGCQVAGEAGDAEAAANSAEALAQGAFIDWNDFHAKPSSIRAGIDFRFLDVRAPNDAKFWISDDHDQRFHLVWDGTPDNTGLRLLARTFKIDPGQYFKGWLLGTVINSTNDGLGFCGFGGVNGDFKAPFRTQLQMTFSDGEKELAVCYCNLCPVKDGDKVACATDQWNLKTGVSDDGACRAPKGSTKVAVAIEGVAKAPESVHPSGSGTGSVSRFRFARCKDDGTCNGVVPDWYSP